MIVHRPLNFFGCDLAAELHTTAFTDQGGEQWDAATFRELLATPGTAGLLALVGPDEMADPVGLILYRQIFDDAEILTLTVHPLARRQGIGRALVHEALRRCTEKGALNMALEVALDNYAARRLYKATGFIEGSRRVNYYRRSDHSMDAIRLSRPLT